MIERVALGTVQFGLRYGVANSGPQPGQDECSTIVRLGREAGMNTLDTAPAYGESEMRLGEIGVGGWRVVTKTPALPPNAPDIGERVRNSVTTSLARLRADTLGGLLVHRSGDLLGCGGPALLAALRQERDSGRVEKIGVSIYEPGELDVMWPAFIPDLVQAPFSVVDRRLETSGWLRRLHDAGVEVHARSVFLQGLLLMDGGTRPKSFDRWSPLWSRWDDWLSAEQLSPLHAALRHVLSYSEISRVVVGVDSAAQLRQIIAATDGSAARAAASLASLDSDLLNPSRWAAL